MVSGSGRFRFALGQDFFGSALKFILGCNVADGTVQATVIVMVYKINDQTLRIAERQRGIDPNIAINGGPLSEIIRGLVFGNFSRARCTMISTSASVMDSRISPWTMYRR